MNITITGGSMDEWRTYEEWESNWWRQLSTFQRLYFATKARYYAMSSKAVAAVFAVILIGSGALAFVFGQSAFVSVVLLVIGIVLGVIAVWETERKK